MDKKLIALIVFFVILIVSIAYAGVYSINKSREPARIAKAEQERKVVVQAIEDKEKEIRERQQKVEMDRERCFKKREARNEQLRQADKIKERVDVARIEIKERSNVARIETFEAIWANMLRDGAMYSMNVEFNEVRINPVLWLGSDLETKRQLVMGFSAYFDLKGSTKRVTVRSSLNDTKMATYGSWGGLKIFY